MKFFPYAQQTIDNSDKTALQAVIDEAAITRGPKVEAFERAVAEYCDARYAIAFNSGTSALHAAYFAAGTGPHDRVITTPNTFVGTVVGARLLGAQLILSDIDPATGNLDLEQLPNLDPPSRGRLIYVPVHYAGTPVDMHALERKITQPSAMIIEDGAAALGAAYPDLKKVGSCVHSDMTTLSFHPAKTITTGEGGMVTTNDETLARRLRTFRNNGLENGLAHTLTGNFHMSDLNAALGLSQFARLGSMVRRRRAIVRNYRKLLAKTEQVQLLPEAADATSAHNLFVVLIDFEKLELDRDTIRAALKEKGVGTQVHYTPLYRHPAIEGESLPNMEQFNSQALTLPLYPGLKEANLRQIVEALQETLRRP